MNIRLSTVLWTSLGIVVLLIVLFVILQAAGHSS